MSYPEQDLSFNKNEDKMKHLLADLLRKLEQIYLGGGQKKSFVPASSSITRNGMADTSRTFQCLSRLQWRT